VVEPPLPGLDRTASPQSAPNLTLRSRQELSFRGSALITTPVIRIRLKPLVTLPVWSPVWSPVGLDPTHVWCKPMGDGSASVEGRHCLADFAVGDVTVGLVSVGLRCLIDFDRDDTASSCVQLPGELDLATAPDLEWLLRADRALHAAGGRLVLPPHACPAACSRSPGCLEGDVPMNHEVALP
jgi:hypothetical protein